MNILITGATGQVGSEVVLLCQKNGWQTFAYSSQELDITNLEQIKRCFKQAQPNCLINCAAYTKVDLAEDAQDKAFAVNATGVQLLAEQCKQHDIPLIHISTDYVFDGTQSAAYQETDTPNPKNAYGKSKWAGEGLLRSTWNKHIILRVSWAFGRFGDNFVKTMLKLKDKEVLKIVADQQGSPTGAYHLAKVITDLIEHPDLNKHFGTYHYTDSPSTNWFDYATCIFKKALSYKLIDRIPELIAITTQEYPVKALRPLNSKMDCAKIKKTFGIQQARWEEELDFLLDYLKKE